MIESSFFVYYSRSLTKFFYLFVNTKNSNIWLTLRDEWEQGCHVADKEDSKSEGQLVDGGE